MTRRGTEELRREIEAERAALERAVTALKADVAPRALMGGAGSALWDVSRRNRVALAVTGAGLALFLVARRKDRSSAHIRTERKDSFPMTKRPDAAFTGAEPSSGGTAAPSGIRARARATAEDLSRRIDEGLGELPKEARARVRRAREAAIAAQRDVERQLNDTAGKARRTGREHPLLVGAAIFAAGAAIAACLPRTETEDRTLGAHRDRLLDEADRIFRDEVEKLKSAARAAVGEGVAAASDAIRADGPPVDAEAAVHRMSNAARAEARRQGLGRMS